jgi:hypothetical protein
LWWEIPSSAFQPDVHRVKRIFQQRKNKSLSWFLSSVYIVSMTSSARSPIELAYTITVIKRKVVIASPAPSASSFVFTFSITKLSLPLKDTIVAVPRQEAQKVSLLFRPKPRKIKYRTCQLRYDLHSSSARPRVRLPRLRWSSRTRCAEKKDIPAGVALHDKASERVGVTWARAFSFWRYMILFLRHCLARPFLSSETTARRLSRRDDITAAVLVKQHQDSLGRSPPPSTVLVWRPARRFERSWRKPRGGTVRRKVSFFPATLLVKRVWP